MNSKFIIHAFIIILISTIVNPALGKEREVKGKITAFKVFAVNNASIVIKSTNTEIVTDTTGYFNFTCDDNDKLTVSANGFFTEKINLKDIAESDSVNVDLRLKKGKKNIEYATGYGHISEKNLTYAIEHLEVSPDYSSYRNILEILEGRVSGVTVGSSSIIIRGATTLNGGPVSALLVVDGTIVDFAVFANIPPTQVKSIDVLKGAAASARYGSRGMGGVVVVQTKTSN
ncbi:Plug and carboxypeptidase regulatory-like domain-containing protein [Draconibacterium sp.]|nr:Plug and carboxypeptidase regulatory-like domain-containing protein [Draconibacterium sp.]